jgi:hypothetical protein
VQPRPPAPQDSSGRLDDRGGVVRRSADEDFWQWPADAFEAELTAQAERHTSALVTGGRMLATLLREMQRRDAR